MHVRSEHKGARATSATLERDYGLTGSGARQAIEAGLAEAPWYSPPVDGARMQQLMVRSNGRAARDVVLWLALLVGAGALAFWSLGTWWAIPAFAIYGALYGSSADARWHECGHGTAFRSRRANDTVYVLASFMMLREPTLWRWSHFRHHSDTLIVGRDPEILFMRPFRLRLVVLNLLWLLNGPKLVWRTVRHAAGRVDDETRDFVPRDELRRLVWEARAFVAVYVAVTVWCLATWSVVPALFLVLPSFYGVWLLWIFATTQHAGLREDVLDHRLNTRTVYMNPIARFLYLNMNYHLEHHLFPGVPYHALPALHEEVKAYLPPPKRSIPEAYREIVTALRHQRKDPDWELPLPELPDIAVPALVSNEPIFAETVDVEHTAAHVDLGPADLLQPGQLRGVDIGGVPYVLCRPTGVTYALVDGLCTHARAPLADGLLIDGCIECPRHNGRFDVLTGEAVRKPARLRLGTHPVRVVGGRVVAHVERKP
jgi:fatty acid desaturase/nitrite reductase/ring-hydroxylating ferredoxin subunit